MVKLELSNAGFLCYVYRDSKNSMLRISVKNVGKTLRWFK